MCGFVGLLGRGLVGLWVCGFVGLSPPPDLLNLKKERKKNNKKVILYILIFLANEGHATLV